jgi:hypothetical protein
MEKRPHQPLPGDFAQGEETLPRDEHVGSFAEGEETLPRDEHVGSFAEGEETVPRDEHVGSFAEGEEALPGNEHVRKAPPGAVRILIVANRTASTPMLLDEVTRRARAGARFTLLIPPERSAHGDWSAPDAVGLLERAAGDPVAYLDGGPDALGVIHREVDAGTVDEIILCTPPEHLARWIHHDLRHRLEHLQLPVCVMPPEADVPLPDHLRGAMPEGWSCPPPTPGIAGTY